MRMNGFELLPIFIIGLLGSVHCVGMCGGIVGAFSLAAAPRTMPQLASGNFPVRVATLVESVRPRALSNALAYNGGRIASYAGAGAIAGGLAQGAHALTGISMLQSGTHWLAWMANLVLVAIGLYLTGAWHGLAQLERVGATLWRRMQPLTRYLLPVDSLPKTVALGALWGWLPCGMVYSVLLTAMLSGSALSGALVMAVFGLGTLPALLIIGVFGARLQSWTRHRAVRVGSGLLILVFGLLGLLRAVDGLPAGWLDAICITPHSTQALP
jgi:sulfite exporter TauE/SafE